MILILFSVLMLLFAGVRRRRKEDDATTWLSKNTTTVLNGFWILVVFFSHANQYISKGGYQYVAFGDCVYRFFFGVVGDWIYRTREHNVSCYDDGNVDVWREYIHKRCIYIMLHCGVLYAGVYRCMEGRYCRAQPCKKRQSRQTVEIPLGAYRASDVCGGFYTDRRAVAE